MQPPYFERNDSSLLHSNGTPNTSATSAEGAKDKCRAKCADGSDAATSIGAFTTNLFVCMLTSAAADDDSDASLKHLLSTLELTTPPQMRSTTKFSDATLSSASTSTATDSTSLQEVARLSHLDGNPAPAPSSSKFDVSSSIVICPATSPNALAITGYCQTWKPNTVWPNCSFVMIAASVPVAAVFEWSMSSLSSSTSISKSCPTTRSVLLQQCISHLRSATSSIISSLAPDSLLELTTGKCGPFLPRLSGTAPSSKFSANPEPHLQPPNTLIPKHRCVLYRYNRSFYPPICRYSF